MSRTPVDLRRALLVFGALIAAAPSFMQAQPAYRVVLDSGAYSDINGEILDLRYGDDSHLSIDLPIDGDRYPFFGVPLPMGAPGRCQVLSVGGIRVDGDTAFALVYAGAAIIGGSTSKLDVVDSTSKVSYRRDGEPGRRIMKFQWRNGGIHNGKDSGYVNVQMWVYQASGVIEFRYGPRVMVPVISPGEGFSAGLLIGPSAQIAVDRKFWLAGDPSVPDIDTQTVLKLPRLKGLPGDGGIIRLIPAAGSGVPVAGTFDRSIGVAPCPAHDRVRILSGDVAGADARLYDLRGDMVLSRHLEHGREELDISMLPSGTYMLHIIRNGAGITIPVIRE